MGAQQLHTPERISRWRGLLAAGYSLADISKLDNISIGSIRNALDPAYAERNREKYLRQNEIVRKYKTDCERYIELPTAPAPEPVVQEYFSDMPAWPTPAWLAEYQQRRAGSGAGNVQEEVYRG